MEMASRSGFWADIPRGSFIPRCIDDSGVREASVKGRQVEIVDGLGEPEWCSNLMQLV